MEGHTGIVLALCTCGNKLYSGSQDCRIMVREREREYSAIITESKRVLVTVFDNYAIMICNTYTCTCVLIYVAFHVQGLEYWELWEGEVGRSSWESCMYSDLSQKHVVQWIPEGCQGETIDRLTILDWLLISIKLVLLNLLTHDSCQPTLTFTLLPFVMIHAA